MHSHPDIWFQNQMGFDFSMAPHVPNDDLFSGIDPSAGSEQTLDATQSIPASSGILFDFEPNSCFPLNQMPFGRFAPPLPVPGHGHQASFRGDISLSPIEATSVVPITLEGINHTSPAEMIRGPSGVSNASSASIRARRSPPRHAERLMEINQQSRETFIRPYPDAQAPVIPDTRHRMTRRPPPRSSSQPMSCPECGIVLGGKHELKRHEELKHHEYTERYEIVHPSVYNLAPAIAQSSSLTSCKHCPMGKLYGGISGAAAHLRRCHFQRKPVGGGSSGGNWPPLNYLERYYIRKVYVRRLPAGDGGKEERFERLGDEALPWREIKTRKNKTAAAEASNAEVPELIEELGSDMDASGPEEANDATVNDWFGTMGNITHGIQYGNSGGWSPDASGFGGLQ